MMPFILPILLAAMGDRGPIDEIRSRSRHQRVAGERARGADLEPPLRPRVHDSRRPHAADRRARADPVRAGGGRRAAGARLPPRSRRHSAARRRERRRDRRPPGERPRDRPGECPACRREQPGARLQRRRRVAQSQRRFPLHAVRAGARAPGVSLLRSAGPEGALDAGARRAGRAGRRSPTAPRLERTTARAAGPA